MHSDVEAFSELVQQANRVRAFLSTVANDPGVSEVTEAQFHEQFDKTLEAARELVATNWTEPLQKIARAKYTVASGDDRGLIEWTNGKALNSYVTWHEAAANHVRWLLIVWDTFHGERLRQELSACRLGDFDERHIAAQLSREATYLLAATPPGNADDARLPESFEADRADAVEPVLEQRKVDIVSLKHELRSFIHACARARDAQDNRQLYEEAREWLKAARARLCNGEWSRLEVTAEERNELKWVSEWVEHWWRFEFKDRAYYVFADQESMGERFADIALAVGSIDTFIGWGPNRKPGKQDDTVEAGDGSDIEVLTPRAIDASERTPKKSLSDLAKPEGTPIPKEFCRNGSPEHPNGPIIGSLVRIGFAVYPEDEKEPGQQTVRDYLWDRIDKQKVFLCESGSGKYAAYLFDHSRVTKDVDRAQSRVITPPESWKKPRKGTEPHGNPRKGTVDQ